MSIPGSSSLISGYLDVKISAKSRRGLTPWKAWQKQWCEIKRLDSIKNGIHLTLKSSEGSILNSVLLPRCSTICRTESRTKQYAFGVFTIGKCRKPLLFLSGDSESHAQEWMSSIRKMLSVACYLPVGDLNFHVSLVDNLHSRTAGYVGLFGVLGSNAQEINLSDPCTGDLVISWNWHQFHQFHLQAPAQAIDDKMILVMHTSGEFPAGPGQLYLFCKDGARLLNHLVARGKLCKSSPGFINKRLSRSEGDLYTNINNEKIVSPDSPMCFRSQSGSDDSGVRVSVSSDEYALLKSKIASSYVSIGIGVLTKTPGGSETNDDSMLDLSIDADKCYLPRRESRISLASGIYEEILDFPLKDPLMKTENLYTNHIYENPIDVLETNVKLGKHCKPPPLPPPRVADYSPESDYVTIKAPYKQRCNTLPAKDLSKISQTFIASENEYVVMSPSKTLEKTKDKIKNFTESFYMPMSPVITLKNKIESCYMSMNGKKN